MPRVLSVNNHRFPGPNQYYTFQGAYPNTGLYPNLWTSPSPGVLVSVFPQYNAQSNSVGTGWRYDLTTNTYTVQTFAFGTYPNLEGPSTINFRAFGYCSLGNGYSLVVVYDTASGTTNPRRAWVYNDQTRTYSSAAVPPLTMSEGSPPPSIGLYQVGTNLAFLEIGGTAACTYNRLSNTWSLVSDPMPRTAWSGAYITDNLLFLVGRNTVSGVNYPAESFLFDNSTRTYTNARLVVNLVEPFVTWTIGGTAYAASRSGLIARLPEFGVIGFGTNNTWAIYNHNEQAIRYRTRSTTDPNGLVLLRPNPTLLAIARQSSGGTPTASVAYAY